MEQKKSIRDISTRKTEKPNLDPISYQETVIRPRKTKISKETEIDDISKIIDNKENTFFILFQKIKNIIKNIKPVFLIGFLILIIILSIIIFSKPTKTEDGVEKTKNEAELVKKELSKHMIISEDEQMDIRKITSKVEDPFFQNAEIGDYLIIMYKSRIAYIYSIEKGLIVNAGVVFIDPKTATTTKQ